MNKITELLKDADPLQHEPHSPDESRREAIRRAVLTLEAASAERPSMAPKRRSVRLITAALIAVSILILIARLLPSMVTPSHAAVPFEVRLAEVQAGPGLREAKVQGQDKAVYLHDEVIVSNADIAR